MLQPFVRVARFYLVFLRGLKSVRDAIDIILFIFEILCWHSNRLCTEADSKMRSKMESMDGRKKREFVFKLHDPVCRLQGSADELK